MLHARPPFEVHPRWGKSDGDVRHGDTAPRIRGVPQGTRPATNPCTPDDLHATVFKAMGIDHRTELQDRLGRPFQIRDGEPLPLF